MMQTVLLSVAACQTSRTHLQASTAAPTVCSQTDLHDGIEPYGTDRQALHALLVLPEPNIVLEGKEVKDRVQQRD